MRKLAALAAATLISLTAIWGGTSLALRDGGGSSGILLPPAGIDEFEVNGQVTIDLSPIFGPTEKVPVSGTMVMERSDPDPVSQTIEIEIVELSLMGTSSLLGSDTPVEILLNPSADPAMGQIDASLGFPAESFFDVFFMDINIGEFGHFAQNTINMSSQITGIPPFGDKFGSGPMENPIQDNLAPTRTVGFLLDLNIDIKPPPKIYTITVLKRNDETKEGLSGWEMNLYQRGGCIGSPLDSGTTGADGLLEFGGLAAGTYSVEEKPQSGWNNVTPLCQDTTLPSAAGGTISGLPACPIQPDLPFPDPGCDEFSSVATVQVVFTNPPIDPLECDLSGPTQVTRGPVVSTPPDSIDTEIVAMELTGECQPGSIAVAVRVSPDRASTGRIVEQADSEQGVLEFKANSFFDVFFEIDTPLGTLHNQDSLHLSCKIQEIPPYGCLYEPDVGVIPLFDVTGKEVGTLLHAAHIPLDPKQKLLIFSNEPKPEVTPTPTPAEKLFSVTVLKVDDETNQPLEDFEFNLYVGPGCDGTPVDSGATDGDGLLDFINLQPGSYSVEEKSQGGWNVVGEECQDVDVGGAVGGSAGFIACPNDLGDFPAKGCDSFDSGAQVNIEINATGDIHAVTLNGPTVIQRSAVGDTEPNGLDDVQTEIIQLDLTGTSALLGPVIVRQSSEALSLGAIEEQENTNQGQIDFPADSFFDVFFEVDVLGMTLHNQDPFRIECKIDEIPPLLCLYQPPVPDPIVLYNEDKEKIATIVHGLHIPLPPNEVLVVFRNRQKGTPTPTATLPPGEGTATPTPTRPPTATPTATVPPTPNDGDINCDDTTNSLDALFVLQDVAGLLDLEDDPLDDCPGQAKRSDTDHDGRTTSIDAALILQHDAGLIMLPMNGNTSGVTAGFANIRSWFVFPW